MQEEITILTPLQIAFNDGVEAAKAVIREHPTEDYCEFDYWRASLINAIARKVDPYGYGLCQLCNKQSATLVVWQRDENWTARVCEQCSKESGFRVLKED